MIFSYQKMYNGFRGTDGMLKRKIYDALLDWKNHHGEECLLIKGARQTGKTYVTRYLGAQEYEQFIEINFIEHPEFKEAFQGSLDSEEILKRMSLLIPGMKIVPGKTLLFLDEIQKCAHARTALKFLARDRRLDVIASGSLLGLQYGEDADPEVEKVDSIPVGYEHQITLNSLDFEEFLWAEGYDEAAIAPLRQWFNALDQVPEAVNRKFETLFREYMAVGGMPEAVNTYEATKNFSEVQQAQEKILDSYADDISNHARGEMKTRVREAYQSIPRQLAREYRKFKYSEIDHHATSRKYGSSVQWLNDAGMISLCRNVSEPYIPLTANEKENEFKVYMNDTGLLTALYGLEAKHVLINNTMKGNAKGGLFENIIGEMLVKQGYLLHYYKVRDNTQELEFIIEKDGEVVPIEVKAGNTATISMNMFLRQYHPSKAYKLIDGNIGVSDGRITLPHYMAMFL